MHRLFSCSISSVLFTEKINNCFHFSMMCIKRKPCSQVYTKQLTTITNGTKMGNRSLSRISCNPSSPPHHPFLTFPHDLFCDQIVRVDSSAICCWCHTATPRESPTAYFRATYSKSLGPSIVGWTSDKHYFLKPLKRDNSCPIKTLSPRLKRHKKPRLSDRNQTVMWLMTYTYSSALS